jgi:hypothetical protein
MAACALPRAVDARQARFPSQAPRFPLWPGTRLVRTFLCVLFFTSFTSLSAAYSVLSHEELIDISWDSEIRPALLRRFPSATPQEIEEAHAYAYGGSIIQDLGYYPLGNHKFTDLLHYVRTGDFVVAMLRDARDVKEYAFALGALGHYVADVGGHPAVNTGVALEYPKLRRRYGNSVTYEENPEAHLKTEFSFDVVQVAKKRYVSKQYHDFIGFEVSETVLANAFLDTYGFEMDDLLPVQDLTIGTFRFGVSRVIPEMTQVAVATRQSADVHEHDSSARKKFLYHLSRADYQKQFGSKYRRPGIFARLLAFLLKVIPNFGALKTLGYKNPTPQTGDLYFKSMNEVVERYHRLVKEVEVGRLSIPNLNLDTGEPARAGKYRLGDEAYGELLRRLAKSHFVHLRADLRSNILDYCGSGPTREVFKKKRHETEAALDMMRTQDIRLEPASERTDVGLQAPQAVMNLPPVALDFSPND